MSERDKFLTEAMGECWHDMIYNELGDRYSKLYMCMKCTHQDNSITLDNDFSTWEGFGLLWEWSQKQEWKANFSYRVGFREYLVNPDRFADAMYAYLKEREI